ncbi:hypothetical protein A2Y85_03070 [candidate division WOR-3 bacterium RBG_13_43_14]|uniref:histidine kinase n=1 Tax=candidate division WOR-3 bacterium RBG_13_43_14 TaxID=1802590 RepID=A0A1F4UDL4_UNCW3|nr:MAG: hypothetical protein A2Y85_03070 [candidate division WOR-3 bacterium RBG_13_43_14]
MSLRKRTIIIFTAMSLLYTGALMGFMFYLSTTALSLWEKEEIEQGLIIGVNNAPDQVQQATAQRAIRIYRQLKGLKNLYEWQIIGFSVLIGIAFFIVSVVVISLVLFRITRPLNEIARTMLESKDEYQPLKISRPAGEIARVIDAYNNMIDQLEKSRERLKQTERVAAWRDAARIMAHEVRNPLSAMRLSIERLLKHYQNKNKDFPQLFDKNSNMILADIESLEKLIKEFSEFARLPEPKLKSGNINDLIDTVTRDYEHFAANVKIEKLLDKDIPELFIDAELMRRVFHNLYKNAFEVLKDRKGIITVQTRRHNDNIIIEFKDNGPGVDPEFADKIFNAYFTTKAQGSGLGLAIVKKIINDHAGDIELKSQPGKGASLIMHLPISNKIIDRGAIHGENINH